MIFRDWGSPVPINERGMELVDHGSALFPIACYEEEVGANPVPWHWHDDWEIVWVTAGPVVLSVCSEQHLLQPGQGVFINAGIPHAIAGAQPEGCQIRSAVFHPRLIGGMDSVFWQKYSEPLTKNPNCQGVVLGGSEAWNGEFLAYAGAAWQAVDKEDDGYEFETRAALSHAIFLLHRHFPSSRGELSEQDNRSLERIKVMLQYIKEHFAEELTVADVAASASVSESECLRCFRRTIGATPIRYLRQFRIQRAANLLLATDKKVVDVAMECGFGDATYFIRLFREAKGCTPGEYRKKAGKP